MQMHKRAQKIFDYLTMHSFVRFLIVGVINTCVDLFVLNVILFFMGENASTFQFGIAKVISFSVAVVNSYFLNTRWVFKSTNASALKQGSAFVTVSLIGLVLNVLVSGFFFSLLERTSLNHHIVGTFSAIIGTGSVFIWNYFGYKLFVFRSHHVA